MYLPQNSSWVNRLFTDFVNKNKRICLTLDCRGINSNGQGRQKQTIQINKSVILVLKIMISRLMFYK